MPRRPKVQGGQNVQMINHEHIKLLLMSKRKRQLFCLPWAPKCVSQSLLMCLLLTSVPKWKWILGLLSASCRRSSRSRSFLLHIYANQMWYYARTQQNNWRLWVKCLCMCSMESRSKICLLIVQGDGPTLLGRSWLEKIRLNWAQNTYHSVPNQVSSVSGLQEVLSKYKGVFKDELGTVRNMEAELHLQADASPKFFRPCHVPLAIRDAIGDEMDNTL